MKKLFSKLSPSLLITTLALGTMLTVPAFAEQGSGDTTASSDSQTTTETASTDTNTSDSTGTETATTDSSEANKVGQEAHTKAAEMLQELRKDHKEHTEAQRKLFCEAHKTGITTKFSSINTEMAGFQSRIDSILTKVQSYQQSKNVTVANWTSLLAAAQSAQTTSASALAALKGVTPSLDCNNTSVAQDVATFKTAAQTARDDLKAYKAAVQALVKALLDAKNASSTEGSNQ